VTRIVPVAVELLLGGEWVDVTRHVQRRNLITIRRGRGGEASQVEHSACALSLDNTDGRYSPRNPASPYYGLLGRNTPIRVAVAHGATYLDLAGAGRATTPDANPLDITGDIDIRIDATRTWTTAADLAAKYAITSDQRSWAFVANFDGTLSYVWSPNGTAASRIAVTSTAQLPVPLTGRLAVRVTHDVNNGASGNTVTFWHAPTIAGPWTQLGAPIVTSGTTSIHSGTAMLEVGDTDGLVTPGIVGQVHAFELRGGIGGTIVANPDFTAQTVGATSFTDGAGRLWTTTGGASLSNRRWRFVGEVAEWPARSDRSGRDVYVPIEAAGVLRRLSQGSPVLRSALYRGHIFDTAGLVAYWPFEDEPGSTGMAAALTTHGPMTITGSPDLASYEDFVASAPIPVLAGASMRGSIPAYTDTGQTQIRWIMAVPAAGAEAGQTLMLWYGTGSVRRWDVVYNTGGTLRVDAVSADNAVLATTGDVNFAVNGKNLLVSVELTQSGANIGVTVSTLAPGATSGTTTSITITGQTVGRVGTIIISNKGGLGGVAIGHISLQNTVTTLFDLGDQLAAWDGESAGRRLERLCREAGIGFRGRGDLDDTVRLGVQGQADLMGLIREAADTDAGMLYEPPDMLGLGYRTRTSLYNQSPAVTLPYTALGDALDPVDDDQLVRNDVVVERPGGSSARAVQETGPLSILPPPAGVGPGYDTQITVGVQYDLMLIDQATWRLHLGTVNRARYPSIPLNMAVNALAGNPVLAVALLELETGDRLAITGLPGWLPPEDVSQLVVGVQETLGSTTHQIRLTTVPELPYRVAVYGTSRYGPSSTVTAEDLDATETGVDITTPMGPLWDTTASGYRIVIGGEVMTVTAVGSPSGTQQTLTVVRSVNGIVKSHSSGALVELADPAVYAL